jgi:hypothetical protein
VLFSQLVQLAHFALVEHAVCEHGDLVHESAVKHAGTRDTARGEGAGLRSAAPSGAGEHEHCGARALPFRGAEIGPSCAEPTLLASIEIPAQAAQPERRPLAPLSLAPKSSPPLA